MVMRMMGVQMRMVMGMLGMNMKMGIMETVDRLGMIVMMENVTKMMGMRMGETKKLC